MLPCRNALPAPCMYVGLVPKYPLLRPPCDPEFDAMVATKTHSGATDFHGGLQG